MKYLTSFRTDLNSFTEDEKDILEAIGYALTAYRYRIFCSDLFQQFGVYDVHNFAPFNTERYGSHLLPEKIGEGLKFSSSVSESIWGSIWRRLGFR